MLYTHSNSFCGSRVQYDVHVFPVVLNGFDEMFYFCDYIFVTKIMNFYTVSKMTHYMHVHAN